MNEMTDCLELPLLVAAQAQKHVTHNEALVMLDAVVQLALNDRDLKAPPDRPANGSRYLVASAPTGPWAGHAGEIAAWQNGAWAFYKPQTGWVAWITDEGQLLAFNGTSWTTTQQVQNIPMLGVNATADATNRFTVQSDASLFNNAGKGHLIKLNKAAAGDTVSFLFQTGWSGRAEVGTTGDDKLHFKVSPDGAIWRDALVIDGTGSIAVGATAPTADNASSLGSASKRWSAIYAANGAIQTSDARDKDVVGALDAAGEVVDSVDPVLFRWKIGGTFVTDDGQEAPVAGARVHAGFLAQDLKAAMDAKHLDFGAWGLDDTNDPDSRQWTRPDQLIAVLWAALKATRAEVRALAAARG